MFKKSNISILLAVLSSQALYIQASRPAAPACPFKQGDSVSIVKGWIKKDASFCGTVASHKDAIHKEKRLILSTGVLDYAEKSRTAQCNHVSCHCTPAETIATLIEQGARLPQQKISLEEHRLELLDFEHISLLTARDGSKLSSSHIFPSSWKGPGTTIDHITTAFSSYMYVRYQQRGQPVGCIVPASYLTLKKRVIQGAPGGPAITLDDPAPSISPKPVAKKPESSGKSKTGPNEMD